MLNYLKEKILGTPPPKAEKKEDGGVADFELEGQNESGYVFVSRSGQKGRARMSREGDIMFLSMDNPDDLEGLSAEDREILSSEFYFRREEIRDEITIAVTRAAEAVQEPAQEVAQEVFEEKLSVHEQPGDSGSVTRVSLDKPEDDVKYSGMDDKLVSEMACAGIEPSAGKDLEKMAQEAVKVYVVPSAGPSEEARLCDMLVAAIVKNFSALAGKPEAVRTVRSFLDVHLGGKRELEVKDVCAAAAFSRLFPVVSDSVQAVRQRGQDPREFNHKHLFQPCEKALKSEVPFSRPDEGLEAYCRLMNPIMEEYVSALDDGLQQSVPEAV